MILIHPSDFSRIKEEDENPSWSIHKFCCEKNLLKTIHPFNIPCETLNIFEIIITKNFKL